MDLIEKIFGIHLLSIYQEGKRLVEIKLLVVLLEGIKIARLITIGFMFCIFSLVLFVLGLVVLIIQTIGLYKQNGAFSIDFIGMSGIAMAVTGGILIFIALREKSWLKICRADEFLAQLTQINTSSSLPTVPTVPNINIEILTSFVNSIVEQRLKERNEVDGAKTDIST